MNILMKSYKVEEEDIIVIFILLMKKLINRGSYMTSSRSARKLLAEPEMQSRCFNPLYSIYHTLLRLETYLNKSTA